MSLTQRTIADEYDYVVGVDTHAEKHVYAIKDNLGRLVRNPEEMRVTKTNMSSAIDRIIDQTKGGKVLFALEGTSSYGETLCSLLRERNQKVIEVKPPTKKERNKGKNDAIDAIAAADHALSTPVDKVINPKGGNRQKLLRALLFDRKMYVKEHTRCVNALNAKLRTTDLGVDCKKKLKLRQIKEIAAWHIMGDSIDDMLIKSARDLAKECIRLRGVTEQLAKDLNNVILSLAPSLLDVYGVSTITAATILHAYGYKGRVRTREAFASLAGCAPIPASSGKTNRKRIDKRGDRRLNHALHIIVVTRMTKQFETQAFIAKKTAEGKAMSDIRRSLKTSIAKSLFSLLEKLDIQM